MDTPSAHSETSAHAHSARATGSLIAAVVQLDFQPAYVDRIDYLSEPIWATAISQAPPTLFELEERLLELADAHSQTVQKALKAWRRTLLVSYEGWFSKKLSSILGYLGAHGVDLIVLPEYSVPCGVLSQILSAAANRCLVAGSHIVTSDCADSCAVLGVSFDGNGQAVAPIFTPDNKMSTIHKQRPSTYESEHFVNGTKWAPLDLNWKGHNYRLLVQLCSDFIIENDDIRKAREEAEGSQQTLLHVVPALTPVLDDFLHKAVDIAKRKDEIVLFANAAMYGGSGIFFVDRRNKRNGSALAEKGEELITIVEITPTLKSRTGPPTLVPTPAPPIRQLVQAPIYYWGTDKLDATLNVLQQKNLAAIKQHFKQDRLNFPDGPSNKTLNRKLRDLTHRIGTVSNSEIEHLSEFVSLPPEIPTMNEWRCNALYASARFLENQAAIASSQTAELCRAAAGQLKEAATQLLSGLRLGYTPEQISKQIEPQEILKQNHQIACRISSGPSSGRVEAGFISWLKTALTTGVDPTAIRQVVDLIDKIRSGALYLIPGLYDALTGTDQTVREKLSRVCTDYARNREVSRRGLAELAKVNKLVKPGEHILIYGFSTSILNALEAIASEGFSGKINVTVAECKNHMGVDSAWDQIKELTALGFVCKFVTIEAVGRHLLIERPRRVLLGAKFITDEGVVNTLGSLAVAMLARAAGSVITVLASRQKLIFGDSDARGSEALKTRRPSDRVAPANWAESMTEVGMVNYAYDLVSFETV